MHLDQLLQLALGIFIFLPPAALVPAALFGLGFYWRRRPLTLLAAVLWLAYAGYEQAMKSRWLCTGECNIRVDLLLIYPLLLILSLAALVSLRRARRP